MLPLRSQVAAHGDGSGLAPAGPGAAPRLGAANAGFALIALLFTTAVIAAGLAVSLPRIAMQAQRIREERLIYRGEQYQRAIQLYFRKHKRYPASIDDLEETNGERFLRRRYQDPITGKDEWRLVHMGNDGRLTDSLIYDQEEEEDRAPAGIGGGQPSAPIGSSAAQAGPPGLFTSADGRFRGADRARAVRPSGELGGPGQGQAVAGSAPGQYPGFANMRPGQIPAGVPGSVPAGFPPGISAGQPGQTQGAQGPRYAIGNPPPMTQQPGIPATAPPAAQPGGRPQAFGVQGVGNQAARIISDLLTRPRPGGMPAALGQRAGIAGAQPQQAAFTGGIAGVASEAEDHGVKVYQGYAVYNQWEFVYDYRRDPALGGQAVGPQAAAQEEGGQRLVPGQPGAGASPILSITPGSVPGIGAPSVPTGGYQQGVPLPPPLGQPEQGPETPDVQRQPGEVEIDPTTRLPREQPGSDDPNQQSPTTDPNQPNRPQIRGFPPDFFPFPGQPTPPPPQQ